MYVGRIMCTDLVTVPLSATLIEAEDTLKENNINHLIVMDENNELAGIISDRDLKLNQASPATTLSTHELNYLLGQITVGMIMAKNVITITADTTVERAAYIMQQNSISSLPVVENDEAIGIITTTDVIDVLLEAIGLQENCLRLIVLVGHTPGIISDLTGILGNEHINIQSLITWPEKGLDNVFQVVIRVDAESGEKAVNVLRSAGYKVITGYVKDHSPFFPERNSK